MEGLGGAFREISFNGLILIRRDFERIAIRIAEVERPGYGVVYGLKLHSELFGKINLPLNELLGANPESDRRRALLGCTFEQCEVHRALTILDRQRTTVWRPELKLLHPREPENPFVPLLRGSAINDGDMNVIDGLDLWWHFGPFRRDV
jgi:hypothetical protein